MPYAARSASFNGRTDAAAVRKRQRVFSAQKKNARFNACNSTSSEHRTSVDTQSQTHEMEALQELVLTSRLKFLATAYSILRNREDAEDALQDAFLSAYRHFRSFQGRSALKTWFTRIVMNSALMIRRKRKPDWMRSQPESNAPDDTEWIQRISTSLPDPEIIYAERETFQFVNDVLGKLKPALRQAFTLTYYDDISNSEACALLGVSTSAFKSRLMRARRELVSQVQRAQIAPIHSATGFFQYKNSSESVAARQPSIRYDEGL